MNNKLIYLLLEEDILSQLLSLISVDRKKNLLKDALKILGLDTTHYETYNENELSQAILYISFTCKEQDHTRNKILNECVENDTYNIDKSSTPKINNYNVNLKTKKNKFEPEIVRLDIKPNEQQQAIIEHCNENVKVDSFAGAGKSTLSGMIVQELGFKNTLYTAYLKENINDAELKITKNAYTQSALALRYALPASNLNDSFEGIIKAPRASSLLNMIGFERKIDIGSKTINYHLISSLIHKTVLNYCMSISHDINDTHVPCSVIDSTAKIKIIRWSKAYWDCLLSGKNSSEFKVSFPHIMKFWSLSPRIQLDDSFGNIILDEAQDIDGAFYNVLSNHSDRNIIVIGDSYQQLFGWRGAINSMLLF